MMRTVIQVILDLLYPPKCMFCSRLMNTSETIVCGDCLHADLPEVDLQELQVQHFQKAVATFWYEDPVSSAILRFKFYGVRRFGKQFSIWLSGTVRDKLEGRFDLISWVPCSKRRVWTRGFDQSELLAKELGKELGIDVIRTLTKVRHNPKQSKAKDAAVRRANVLGAYEPYLPERFRGKRILLVDDVLTTGATLSECGKTLLIGGSGELVCAVIAAAKGDKNK